MKSYFNQPYLTYSEDANDIHVEVFSFLSEIIKREGALDVNLRELQTVFMDAVTVVIAEASIRRASILRKRERKSGGHQSNTEDSSGGSQEVPSQNEDGGSNIP
jgi:hypothetical protein